MKYMLPILFVFLYSCSSVTVTADYDRDVDFKSYKTFSMLKWRTDNNRLVTEFDKRNIQSAVISEMKQRGYNYKEAGGELAVSVFVLLEDKTSYNSYTDYYGRHGYYYGTPWGWGPARTTVTQYNYTQGTIIFNVFDAQEKKLVWQGTALGEVDNKPQRDENNIPKVVGQVFMRYPIAK